MPKPAPRKKSPKIRIAIVGTGGMANVHAKRFSEIKGCTLTAACDIDLTRAQVFAAKHNISEVYTSLEEMLSSAACDAVSVVTPDAFHKPVTLAALAAQKHVLCEKPLALNAADASQMYKTAQRAGVVHMVNFSYRNWPAIQAAARVVQRGEIGEVRHVEASYMQGWLASLVWGDWRTNPAWLWRLSTSHGSMGVLGDVGVHIVDFATFPCGPVKEVFCRLQTFPKAKGNRLGPYRLDANDSAVINVQFANGALGVIHTTRWAAGHPNRLALKISGTTGSLSIDSDLSVSAYRICAGEDAHKAVWKEVECAAVPDIYQRFVSAMQGRPGGEPGFERGVEVQAILDACVDSHRKNAPVTLRARRLG